MDQIKQNNATYLQNLLSNLAIIVTSTIKHFNELTLAAVKSMFA
ncbi:hypothetical protein [Nitrosomonas communis]